MVYINIYTVYYIHILYINTHASRIAAQGYFANVDFGKSLMGAMYPVVGDQSIEGGFTVYPQKHQYHCNFQHDLT